MFGGIYFYCNRIKGFIAFLVGGVAYKDAWF